MENKSSGVFHKKMVEAVSETLPQDYTEKVTALIAKEETVASLLPPNVRDLFEDMEETAYELQNIQNISYFSAGFKMGIDTILKKILSD